VPMDVSAARWFDDELAGCNFVDERLCKRLRRLLAVMEGRWARAFLLPAGLGQHKGSLPVLLQREGERGRDPGRSFSDDAAALCCDRGTDPGPAGHDGVHLPAGADRGDRVHLPGKQRQGQGWPLQDAHGLRAAHACGNYGLDSAERLAEDAPTGRRGAGAP
jgi:hypothetical protein